MPNESKLGYWIALCGVLGGFIGLLIGKFAIGLLVGFFAGVVIASVSRKSSGSGS